MSPLLEIRDLTITNRAKDQFIDQLKLERASILDEVISKSHRIGQLEERLQLGPGRAPAEETASGDIHVSSESVVVDREPEE